ncbi:MAG TPA: ATP-dependent Clp protease ATP-binding subunit [bacterium]|jgi:ATP-dependent Clp protease ATP-binding subunit ClpC|nr:ATP-dependent Clp protease ATP-binding subunit [bacterium]HOG38354.1 ATP-dependent Clp protease ATP-binding subunit [bacterium]HQI03256.1 ATP-dependent Clp protease ATP-binding subunit [bacterium]
MKNLERANIVYCENCTKNTKCSYCRGTKYYLQIGNQAIYFDKSFSKESILFDNIKSSINLIINSILGIIGFIGILSIIFHVYNIFSLGGSIFFAGNWLGEKVLVFYCGVLALMLFFYRLQIASYIRERVLTPDVAEKNKRKSFNAYNSFSKQVKKILFNSHYLAIKNKQNISPLHVLYVMLDNVDFIVILSRLGISNQVLKSKVKTLLSNLKDPVSENVYFLDSILNSYYFAFLNKSEYVRISHLILAISTIDERIFELFFDMGVDANQLRNAIAWIRLRDDMVELYKKYKKRSSYKPSGNMNRSMTAVATPTLDRFGSDLTRLAKYGYLNLVVGRDEKIDEIYRSIETSNKGVLIMGAPGVGKKSIIEGLANKMSAEDVPDQLKDKRLVSLSLSKFVSEASSGGNVEFLFMKVIEEIARSGNIILVINDIHNIVGVVSFGNNSIDLSKILADGILRYGIVVIGTTSEQEYKKYLENNSLVQTMNIIDLPEPNFDDTVQILESRSFSLEHKHKIYFSYQAIEKIVKLTNEYIHTFKQPVKAIRVMEEVAIVVKSRGGKKLVTAEDVAKVISQKVNIPLGSITISESEKLLNLEKIMHERIIGQDEAVNMVASALRRSRAELRDENKPIVNLLFLGPTGVGKTELAKTIAEILFGSEKDMVRLDMSEYQEKSSIARLIGFEGSSEGGILTEAIKKNTFCVVLLDELEKAHPDILNVFLQVMDDGRLTDSKGETVDFTNCILIATSNAGSFYIQDKLAEGVDLETIKNDLIMNQLRDSFRPEFLNRFNGIVVFKPLTQKEIEAIAVLMLDKISKRLEEKGMFFSASPDAVRELAQIGFSREFGARPLARTIEERVNNSLANMLLTNKIGRRDRIILEKGGEIRVEKASRI